MKSHLKYLSYGLRHKWCVFVECWKAHIPWRGICHDNSKFRLDEWFPYVNYFYGNRSNTEAFNRAWLLHQRRNPHHWQWWILTGDEFEATPLPMEPQYRLEMLCDWRGSGRAQGYGDNTVAWYLKNRDKIILHHDTRTWVEAQLGIGG